MKYERQSKILELVDKHTIETQEELAEHLKNEGFLATQATVSRDIRELRLVKVLTDDGRYKYGLGMSGEIDAGFSSRLRTIFRESITSVDCSQNIVVIKTLPGLASAACAAVDNMRNESVVGSLAGDDTGILIMRDSVSAVNFVKEINSMLS